MNRTSHPKEASLRIPLYFWAATEFQELTPADLHVYCQIGSWARPDGHAWVGHRQLGRQGGHFKATVYDSIKRLVEGTPVDVPVRSHKKDAPKVEKVQASQFTGGGLLAQYARWDKPASDPHRRRMANGYQILVPPSIQALHEQIMADLERPTGSEAYIIRDEKGARLKLTMIPGAMLNSKLWPRGSRVAQMQLLIIDGETSGGQVAFHISNKDMARRIGCSIESVKAATVTNTAAGLLVVTEDRGYANSYGTQCPDVLEALPCIDKECAKIPNAIPIRKAEPVKAPPEAARIPDAAPGDPPPATGPPWEEFLLDYYVQVSMAAEASYPGETARQEKLYREMFAEMGELAARTEAIGLGWRESEGGGGVGATPQPTPTFDVMDGARLLLEGFHAACARAGASGRAGRTWEECHHREQRVATVLAADLRFEIEPALGWLTKRVARHDLAGFRSLMAVEPMLLDYIRYMKAHAA